MVVPNENPSQGYAWVDWIQKWPTFTSCYEQCVNDTDTSTSLPKREKVSIDVFELTQIYFAMTQYKENVLIYILKFSFIHLVIYKLPNEGRKMLLFNQFYPGYKNLIQIY